MCRLFARHIRDSGEQADGRQILRQNFEALFEKYPELVTFGEDTGGIGGVNQSNEKCVNMS